MILNILAWLGVFLLYFVVFWGSSWVAAVGEDHPWWVFGLWTHIVLAVIGFIAWSIHWLTK